MKEHGEPTEVKEHPYPSQILLQNKLKQILLQDSYLETKFPHQPLSKHTKLKKAINL